MAIVVDDNTPDFLREFLISQGVISVKDTETGETGVVPIQPRRRQRLNTGEDLGGEDFQQESPVTTAASGDLRDILGGLFSSEDPYDPEANMYYSLQENQTSGNSFIDGATNLVSGIGQSVTDSFSKLGGGNFSNSFDFDYTPSISDRYGPMSSLSGAATALSDRYLSTDRKGGQVLGSVLKTGASLLGGPALTALGLFGAAMGRMGAHHDFNPSTDYNLNFDTRSGRTDWGSLSPGAGGSQYGSLSNENMIEDIAKDNPNFEISLNEGRDGYITAGEWVDINNDYKNVNSSFGFMPGSLSFSEALAASANESGDMFQSFGGGGGTLGGALTEYGQTGTGAFRNEAGAIADQLGLGYNQETGLADRMVDAAKQGIPLGLLGDDALNLDMSMGDLGFGMDFDADDGMGSMGDDMGFGQGDFGYDGII